MSLLTTKKGRRSRSLRAAAVSATLVAALLASSPSGAAGPADEAYTVVGLPPLAGPPDSEGLDVGLVDVFDGAGVAVHPWTDELYYVDQDRHRVRRIDRDNRVWTVAGDGTAGLAGDGGPAGEARLSSPEGIAFDGDGNLYIADTFNHRVRRIDTLGFISTVAGGGTGDGPLALNSLGDGDLAANALLHFPTDVAVTEDGRALYIADTANHRIRKVNAPARPSPFIFTAAGGDPGFSGDGDFAADAQLDSPTGVAVSPEGGNVLIADTFNRRVRVIYPSGVIDTIAGDGDPGRPAEAGLGIEESIGNVTDVAFDHDLTPYFSSIDSNEVFRIEDSRTFRVSGLGGGAFGTADFETYVDPDALAFDASGTLLIAHDFEIVAIVDRDATPAPAPANPFGRPAEDEIRRLYRAAFGRTPDPAGHRFWLERYQGADTIQGLATEFLASPESAAVYGDAPDDAEFIRVLYLNVLDREPDTSGYQFWIEELRSGASRAAVLVSFANSPENVAGSGTAAAVDGSGMEIIRLYRAAFGRFPDTGGASFWYGELIGGASIESIAQRFLDSPEAADFVPTGDNGIFVDRLYGNVLGRGGDAEGAAFWLGQLDSGAMSHAQVLVAFAESPENLVLTGTA